MNKRMIPILHRLDQQSEGEFRFGATWAQGDLKTLLTTLEALEGEKLVELTLDFSGLKSVNGSYVRATVLWLLRCAMAWRKQVEEVDPAGDGLRPLPIVKLFVQNLDTEVRDEISIVCRDALLPCIEVSPLGEGALLGHLDRAFSHCLASIQAIGGKGSAQDLHEQIGGEVKVTAWNNRLAGLYELMLLQRSKVGRFWIYETTTNITLDNGDRLHRKTG